MGKLFEPCCGVVPGCYTSKAYAIVITRRIGEFVRGWSAMRQEDKSGWIIIGVVFEESTVILQLPDFNRRTDLDLNNANRDSPR